MAKRHRRKQKSSALTGESQIQQQQEIQPTTAAKAFPKNPFVGQALLDVLGDDGDGRATLPAQAANSEHDRELAVATTVNTAVQSEGSAKKKKKKSKKGNVISTPLPLSPIDKESKNARNKAKRERKKDNKKKAAALNHTLEHTAPENPEAGKHTTRASTAHETLPTHSASIASSAAANGVSSTPSTGHTNKYPQMLWLQNMPYGGPGTIQNIPSPYWFNQTWNGFQQSYLNPIVQNQVPSQWQMPVLPMQYRPGQQGRISQSSQANFTSARPFPQAQAAPWKQPNVGGQVAPCSMSHHRMALRSHHQTAESTSKKAFWSIKVAPVSVPRPSPEYLLQAEREPGILNHPQRLLLVMDLNGTLVHRPKRNRQTFKPRPDLPMFIQYLFDNFSVMVWSSARPENVDRMCKNIFNKDQYDALRAEWGRDMLGLTPEQYHGKVQVYKQLSRVWGVAAHASWHPQHAEGARYGAHNTVLLDDSILKASSEPFNLIEVPELGPNNEPPERRVLVQLAAYLDELRWYDNASAFIKRYPFVLDGKWMTGGPLDAAG